MVQVVLITLDPHQGIGASRDAIAIVVAAYRTVDQRVGHRQQVTVRALVRQRRLPSTRVDRRRNAVQLIDNNNRFSTERVGHRHGAPTGINKSGLNAVQRVGDGR